MHSPNPSLSASIATSMIPPQSVEAEQAVLGTILLQDKALLKIVEMLAADDFYRDAHKTIYAAMLTLFEKREPHDLITITSLLNDQNKLDQVGGASYLASLTDIIPFSGTLVHHAQIIRKKIDPAPSNPDHLRGDGPLLRYSG